VTYLPRLKSDDPIHRQDRLQLRNLLLMGASSAPTAPVNEAYFEGLRKQVRGAVKVTGKTRRQP